MSDLRTLGDHINRRVLETESLAHDCVLAPAQLADLVQPTRTPTGLPAPALKFGHPRVTAVLNALCHFLWTANGLTNAQFRPLIVSLLGTTYSTQQTGYDLRRLTQKGVLKRLDHPKRYVLTPYGRRVALFLIKSTRILRPGLQVLDLGFTPQAPPALRTNFTALDRAIDAHIAAAKLAHHLFATISYTFQPCKHGWSLAEPNEQPAVVGERTVSEIVHPRCVPVFFRWPTRLPGRQRRANGHRERAERR